MSVSPVDFPYEIVRSPRRRTVAITVKADGTVRVQVPLRYPECRILRIVSEKSGWIVKKRRHFQELAAARMPKVYVDGERFAFLGQEHALQSIAGSPEHVWRQGESLCVRLPSGLAELDRRERLAAKITTWYREAALEHFRRRVEHFSPRLGVEPTLVGVKGYRSRWGSCHRDGRIYFNWRLVMAPTSIVDYVVVHELCHLLQHDHSPRFWCHVEAICPDYRAARRWLKVFGHQLDL